MLHNFSPGPAAVYKEVLHYVQNNLINYENTGISLLESSHREKAYQEIHQKTIEQLTYLLELDDEHAVLLLAGGATLQFSMLPLNLLANKEKKAEYVVTGAWGLKACDDAKKIGKGIQTTYDGRDHSYTILPQLENLYFDNNSAYVHFTSNETIHGLQWKEDIVLPAMHSKLPVVVDMSSDILSRRINANSYDIIYASTQKNMGIAGLTIVIIKKDLINRSSAELPSYLSYATHFAKNSLYNTPPVSAVWILSLVLDHIISIGEITTVEALNEEKAEMLYEVIDNSNGFYHCPVHKRFRSSMNVVFTLPDKAIEEEFLAQSARAGIYGIKGHRSVGGCRASLYNAVSRENVKALIDFMREFKKKN